MMNYVRFLRLGLKCCRYCLAKCTERGQRAHGDGERLAGLAVVPQAVGNERHAIE